MNEKKHLILLHGALGSKAQFNELKELLADDFMVHAFNFLGHGGRPSSEPFSMDLFADDISDFMKAYAIEESHFFGYSMGGYAALVFACHYPEKARKIMTLGTKFEWTPASAAKEVKMLNPEKIEEKVPKFAAMLKQRHEPLDWKKLLRKTANMMTNLGNGDAWKSETFKLIKKRVLITVGELDNMVTMEESRIIADNLPYGDLMMIQNFPHPIEKVNKEMLAQMISKFLK